MTQRISAGILLFRRAAGGGGGRRWRARGPPGASGRARSLPVATLAIGRSRRARWPSARISTSRPVESSRRRPGTPRRRPRRSPSASVVQKGGKIVHAWALEGDLDPAAAVSNTFSMRWPPLVGALTAFPEIDRVAWFAPEEARRGSKAAQTPVRRSTRGGAPRAPEAGTRLRRGSSTGHQACPQSDDPRVDSGRPRPARAEVLHVPLHRHAQRPGRQRVRRLAAVRGDRRLLRRRDPPAAGRVLLPPGGGGAEPRHDARPVPARRRRGGQDPGIAAPQTTFGTPSSRSPWRSPRSAGSRSRSRPSRRSRARKATGSASSTCSGSSRSSSRRCRA